MANTVSHWFGVGVRFIGSEFTSGVRAAGRDFHQFIEGQRRDLNSLNGEIGRLQTQERQATQQVRDSKAAYKARVADVQESVRQGRQARQILNANATQDVQRARDLGRQRLAPIRAEQRALELVVQTKKHAHQDDLRQARERRDALGAQMRDEQRALREQARLLGPIQRRGLAAYAKQGRDEVIGGRRLTSTSAAVQAAFATAVTLTGPARTKAANDARALLTSMGVELSSGDKNKAIREARAAGVSIRVRRRRVATLADQYSDAQKEVARIVQQASPDDGRRLEELNRQARVIRGESGEEVEKKKTAARYVRRSTAAGARADDDLVAAARRDTGGVKSAEAVQAGLRQEIAARQDQVKALRLSISEQVAFGRQMQQVRAGIRDHIMGELFGALQRVAFFFGFVKSFGRLATKAAAFQYQARGLSAITGMPAGSGEDVYAAYSNTNRYQAEVKPTEAMGRMSQLAAAGYSRSEIPGATAAIFDTVLASRGEVSISGAVDLGISLHRAFGDLNTSMRDVLDTTVKAANKFPMTVGQIRDAMGYATEAAVTTGQSLEETLVMIGTVMPIVKTPSKAGTSTRNAMMALYKPKTQKWLAKEGINVLDESGDNRPTMDVFLEIRKHLQTKSKEEQATIEYMLTGQRGQGVFAAMDRLTKGGSAAALQGTPFEGMRFARPEDAVEAMRLAVSSAAGESRRLADEMRMTSQVMGDRFSASLERASISAGTFLLPIRDGMQRMGVSLANWVSETLSGGDYGKPGGSPVGGSLGWNLVGGGLSGVAAVAGISSVMTLVRAFSMVGALVRPGTIAKITQLTAGGMPLMQAMGEAGGIGVIGRLRLWTAGLQQSESALVRFGGAALGLAGPILGWSLGIGAILFGVSAAFTAAREAVTDFTAVTDRRIQARQDRQQSALRGLFGAAAEGQLGITSDGKVSVANKGLAKVLRSGGPMAMMVATELAQGVDPNLVWRHAEQWGGNELQKMLPGKQNAAEREKKMAELHEGFGSAYADYGRDAIAQIIGTGGNKMYDPKLALQTVFAQDIREGVGVNMERGKHKGGDIAAIMGAAMQRHHADNFETALKLMDPLERAGVAASIGGANAKARGHGDFFADLAGAVRGASDFVFGGDTLDPRNNQRIANLSAFDPKLFARPEAQRRNYDADMNFTAGQGGPVNSMTAQMAAAYVAAADVAKGKANPEFESLSKAATRQVAAVEHIERVVASFGLGDIVDEISKIFHPPTPTRTVEAH